MRHFLLLFFLAGAFAQDAVKSVTDTPAPVEAPPAPVFDPYPAVEQVEAAMRKAVAFARANLSFAGGYAARWPRDLKESRTSDIQGQALIGIEAPGTPVLGRAFLRGWQVTGDPLYLQAAREAAQALLWTQLASGGWATYHDFSLPWARKQHYRRDLEAGDTDRGDRKAHTTLDDHKTQLALLFLLELAHLPESKNDAVLQNAVQFSLESLLAAQFPNGGWPQGFEGPADPEAPVIKPRLPAEWPREWPAVKYTHFYTINDGNLKYDSNLPTHYGFKSDKLHEDIGKFKQRLALSRQEQLAKLTPPETPKAWLSKAKGAASKVVTALKGQNKEGVWTNDNVIEAEQIVKNLEAFANYAEAAKKAGDLFETLREKENAKP